MLNSMLFDKDFQTLPLIGWRFAVSQSEAMRENAC